jgi:hypothetical protein
MASFEQYFLQRHPEFKPYLNPANSERFMNAAWTFLHTTVNQITQRMPLDEKGILIAEAFSLPQLSSLGKIHQLAIRFSNIIHTDQLTKFGHEIENLECNFMQIKKLFENNSKANWLNIWKTYQDSYSLIYKLARAMQVLPYSTVNIERGFSVATDIKTIKRNNISVGALQACLLAKQEFSDNLITFPSKMLLEYEHSSLKKPKNEPSNKFPQDIRGSVDLTISNDSPQIGEKYIEALGECSNSQDKRSKLYEMLGFATYHNMPKITEAVMEYTDTQPEIRALNLENSLKRGPPTVFKNDGLIKMKLTSQESDEELTISYNKND